MLLDGSSLSVEHSPSLLDALPAGRNRRGLGHSGIVKWVALHDVQTGIALRPEWGPMHGPATVSEQALARRAVERTAASGVIAGDGNFGIFLFAYAIVQSKREVLFRLTKSAENSVQASGIRASPAEAVMEGNPIIAIAALLPVDWVCGIRFSLLSTGSVLLAAW
jgi:hypothetical protein